MSSTPASSEIGPGASGVVATGRAEDGPELGRFFDLAPDLLCVVGFDGYFKHVNPAFEQTLGYSVEEMLRRPMVEFLHPDDQAGATQALGLAARGSQLGGMENRYLDRWGAVHWIQWRGWLAPGQKTLYAAGRDITEGRRYTEEQAALRRLATRVANAAPPEEVFRAVCEEANALLASSGAALMRYEADGTVFVLAQNHLGGVGSHVGTHIRLDGESATSRVLAAGAPARMEDYTRTSGAMVDVVRSLAVSQSVGAPIFADGRIWGVLVCAWAGGRRPPSDAEQHLLRFTELVATAIANAENQAKLATSRKRIVIAADEARRRIQRNLHDSTQQRLVSLELELRGVRSMAADDGPLTATLAHMADALREAREELQDIARGLHPALLSHAGLVPAVGALVRRASIPVELATDLPERLPEPIEIAAYYIVSEALTNAAKHARAASLEVEIAARGGELTVRVRDDGVGGADAGGSGLIGLRDRVEALDGTLVITSPPGAGTTLDVRLPITSEPAGR